MRSPFKIAQEVVEQYDLPEPHCNIAYQEVANHPNFSENSYEIAHVICSRMETIIRKREEEINVHQRQESTESSSDQGHATYEGAFLGDFLRSK